MTGSQKHGFEYEIWTGKMTVGHVRRKYSIGYYSLHNTVIDTHMGLSYIKPRSLGVF